MKRWDEIAAGLVLLLVAATSPVHAQTSVQELAGAWTQAYNRHDRGALGALYTADARLMMHGSPTYEGRESIEDFCRFPGR